MKAAQIWLIFLIPQLTAAAKKEEFTFGARYTNIQCRADNITAVLRYCFLKPYSRRLVTANVGLSFLKPLKSPVLAEVIYSYRYGTIFREVIHSPKMEWCSMMDGAAANPIFSSILQEIKDSVPNLLHKCPYEGEIDLKNITTAHEKAASVFWEGYYKFELLVWKNSKELFYLNLGTQLKSGLKDSFG